MMFSRFTPLSISLFLVVFATSKGIGRCTEAEIRAAFDTLYLGPGRESTEENWDRFAQTPFLDPILGPIRDDTTKEKYPNEIVTDIIEAYNLVYLISELLPRNYQSNASGDLLSELVSYFEKLSQLNSAALPKFWDFTNRMGNLDPIKVLKKTVHRARIEALSHLNKCRRFRERCADNYCFSTIRFGLEPRSKQLEGLLKFTAEQQRTIQKYAKDSWMDVRGKRGYVTGWCKTNGIATHGFHSTQVDCEECHGHGLCEGWKINPSELFFKR